jgi:predicted ATPase
LFSDTVKYALDEVSIMLLRLRARGFKSLEDVEVRFGPINCVVGPNGAGKSNLFDAIQFLGRLADMPVDSASRGVRGAGMDGISIASLFTATRSRRAESMQFEADFIVDEAVIDDSGRQGRTPATALRYALCLRRIGDDGIEIESESLQSIPQSEAPAFVGFAATPEFMRSVFGNGSDDLLHNQPAASDAGATLDRTRTKLARIATVDHPAALAARREMQSWTVLRLEPTALRQRDAMAGPDRLASDGSHLPATLARLNQGEALAYRLAGLLPNVTDIVVDIDPMHQYRTFHLQTVDGGRIDAGAAPDGVLRLLALAALTLDQSAGKVLCIEEPENGIHPAGMGAIVRLLAEMAVDPAFAIDADNPLRQVIINTHAPAVVQALDSDALLVARTYRYDGTFLSVFSPLVNSWRASTGGISTGAASPVSLGALLAYFVVGDDELSPSAVKLTMLREFRDRVDQTP